MAKKSSVGRRGFLKSAAASAAALATTTPLVEAQVAAGSTPKGAPAPTQALCSTAKQATCGHPRWCVRLRGPGPILMVLETVPQISASNELAWPPIRDRSPEGLQESIPINYGNPPDVEA